MKIRCPDCKTEFEDKEDQDPTETLKCAHCETQYMRFFWIKIPNQTGQTDKPATGPATTNEADATRATA